MVFMVLEASLENQLRASTSVYFPVHRNTYLITTYKGGLLLTTGLHVNIVFIA